MMEKIHVNMCLRIASVTSTAWIKLGFFQSQFLISLS